MFGIFSLWSTFNNVVFYLTLAVSLAGLVGNGLVLWHLGLHITKGPFNVYLLHLAAADFLFLACQLGFSVAQMVQGSGSDNLGFAVTFLWFAAGLWLLAALSTDGCLTHMLAVCSLASCRPKHTSTVLCVLVWGLTAPAVLLPAHACGLLRSSARLLTCLRYHVASITWLATLAGAACGTNLVLFVWVTCCSLQRPFKLYRLVQSSGILLFFCRLPMVLYWSLRPLLNFLFPFFPPLAVLLACVDSSCKPLLYFLVGRRPGTREPLRVVLNRALGEKAQLNLGGLSLPMSHM
uniref:mas-related G-protein coupled receptor member G n=1 Tax=Jaculus jaculus TaxID=51337 RepID=UPI001E1B1C67|nr:mas-related G-protein coupled receptor member G [Jaculus jaculus]